MLEFFYFNEVYVAAKLNSIMPKHVALVFAGTVAASVPRCAQEF